jgi:uncharacterized pyridoxal phosphate-containing UPF0001 family protein
MRNLQQNLALVRSRLEAARRPSREEVRLLAVTKNVPAALIGEAITLGVQSFGENRLQEAMPKMALFPQADWHFIGRLQTNKVRDVVGRFSLIHSLDRWELAMALQQQAEKKGDGQSIGSGKCGRRTAKRRVASGGADRLSCCRGRLAMFAGGRADDSAAL